MRDRLILIACVFGLAHAPLLASAQRRPQQQPQQAPQPQPEQPPEGEEEDVPAEGEELEEQPQLRPPTLEPIEVEDGDEETEATGEEEIPTPADAAAMLEAGAPDTGGGESGGWTAPKVNLSLHGYFRLRPELWDTFFLGRIQPGASGGIIAPPFDRFVPRERGATPAGGCGDEPATMAGTDPCDRDSLGFANMRLRLEPTVSLSEDVAVHAQLDVLDNVVLGSTPDGSIWTSGGDGFSRAERTPGVPLDSFSATAVPPVPYRNSLEDSIVVRRAWGEVTNRGLGQLRFGRMGFHWGLGLVANGGDGIDSDWQTDVDRIMAITKIAGLYIAAGYDFVSEGFVDYNELTMRQLTIDPVQEDDVDQYVLAVARRMDEEKQKEALQRGEIVLNFGGFLVYRTQFLSSAGIGDPFAGRDEVRAGLVRRDAEAFIPDLWAQLKWRSLRVEVELAMIGGSIQNTNNTSFEREDFGVLMFGGALEAEYRLLDDKLGLYFYTGYATGDPNVDGLSVTQGLQPQFPGDGDDNISTFRFHPNYRIDLILWRNILWQVAGAYYFKPGISYDFIRNSFGQLLGARADIVWSRASQPVQTWGSDPDLGLELNASIYYRSEDGPDIVDGFFGMVQYGILFPMAGLGFMEDEGIPEVSPANPELENAQIVRGVLGIQF